jgi:hypothetical protein
MKRFVPMFTALLGILLTTPRSEAQIAFPSLSLSTGANLSNLTVGQTVTFNVNLTGLQPGNTLNFLDATLHYDPGIFGLATNIKNGAILPNPLFDPADFGTTTGAGLIDGGFFTTGPSPSAEIASNGVFYSFDLMAIGAGKGVIGFDFTVGGLKLSSQSESIQFTPTPGPDLAYTVKAASTGGGGGAVPLPSSVWGGLILLGVVLVPTVRRSRLCTLAA